MSMSKGTLYAPEFKIEAVRLVRGGQSTETALSRRNET